MKLPALLLIGGGALALTKLLSLKKAGDELSIVFGEVAVTRIESGSLRLWAEVWYDNFTGTQLRLRQPSVKIFLTDTTTEIGHALPSDVTTDIPARGRNTEPQTIHMAIPLSNIVFAIPALMAGGKANRKILIQIKTTVNGVPYTNEKEYTI